MAEGGIGRRRYRPDPGAGRGGLSEDPPAGGPAEEGVGTGRLAEEGVGTGRLAEAGVGTGRPAAGDGAFLCDLCGGTMLNRHCKLICRQCGYQRDCSDP